MSTQQGQVSTQSAGPLRSTYQQPQVLGARTGAQAPGPAPVEQTGDGGPPPGPDPNQLLQQNWDAYAADLDAQLGTLGSQRTAQEGVVGQQATQALGQLGLQKEQGLQQLESQRTRASKSQKKNLRDLAANITNAMRAGNIYLGARGAADSSAANQYAYALTKLGTRERSNVMQDTAEIMDEIAGRETNLTNIYNTETNRIESEKNENLNRIADWYHNAVQTIQSQKTQNRAQLSQQILDKAMRDLEAVQQYSMNTRQALDQWALNNSQTLQEVKSNIQGVSSFAPQLPQAGAIAGTPQVSGQNLFTPGYGGSFGDEEERLFG
jgi:hypothetical protein